MGPLGLQGPSGLMRVFGASKDPQGTSKGLPKESFFQWLWYMHVTCSLSARHLVRSKGRGKRREHTELVIVTKFTIQKQVKHSVCVYFLVSSRYCILGKMPVNTTVGGCGYCNAVSDQWRVFTGYTMQAPQPFTR